VYNTIQNCSDLSDIHTCDWGDGVVAVLNFHDHICLASLVDDRVCFTKSHTFASRIDKMVVLPSTADTQLVLVVTSDDNLMLLRHDTGRLIIQSTRELSGRACENSTHAPARRIDGPIFSAPCICAAGSRLPAARGCELHCTLAMSLYHNQLHIIQVVAGKQPSLHVFQHDITRHLLLDRNAGKLHPSDSGMDARIACQC
jgi:hypothetical protein